MPIFAVHILILILILPLILILELHAVLLILHSSFQMTDDGHTDNYKKMIIVSKFYISLFCYVKQFSWTIHGTDVPADKYVNKTSTKSKKSS